MPKPPNKQNMQLIHVAVPEEYHAKFKEHTARVGSNITATVNNMIEDYLIENGMIKKVVDKSIIVDT